MEEAGETRGGGSSKTKEKLPPAATPTEHEIGGTTVMGLPAADVMSSAARREHTSFERLTDRCHNVPR